MNITIRIIVSVLFFVFPIHSSDAQEELTYRASTQLPDTRPEMNTPGFWIGRHPSVDEIIMTADGIRMLNISIRNKVKEVKDIARVAENFSGDELTKTVRLRFDEFKAKEYFSRNGEPVSELFFQDQLSNLNLTSVPSVIEPEFAFVLRYTNQRFLPTDEPIFERPGDLDFDYLQNNALEIATPVVILHKSFDGQWVYALGPTSDGWIKTRDIVFCALKDVEDFLNSEKWAVVTNAKADLFSDGKLTQFEQYVQMGARFPKEKKQESNDVAAVRVPFKRSDGRFAFKTVYLDQSDVNEGYLPYSARTIYKQAFKLLNEPYGWGGMYGEQDCSRFLQMIFATVGIDLPRDSKDQARVGTGIVSFDLDMPGKKVRKLDFFPKATPGISILNLKGHIMLYLGEVDGRPYAIHAVWAYREPDVDQDRVRVINRVVVSSLDLGEGSKKGSLLERLTGIRNFIK